VNIHQLLLEYYLAWQKEMGDVKSWKDFAELIGMDHVYLNKIYNGRRKAGEKTIQHLANYFKDPRVTSSTWRNDRDLEVTIYRINLQYCRFMPTSWGARYGG
jgi:transcriptional regulator with XRE-family HTH domain